MGHIRALPGLLEVKTWHHQAAEDMKRAGCVLLVACFQVSCLGLQNSKSSQVPFSHSYFFWLWCFMSLSLWRCCPTAAQHEALHPSLLGSYRTFYVYVDSLQPSLDMLICLVCSRNSSYILNNIYIG